ncbi:coiled-coil domain-containing protein 174-like isoform X2 [Branchiostoma floridae]|uniref:Coiled-coil domain-containing protein 174-like isoform X2 n=1 Tax=Branchiostoma floridae TaxID=7739 RepID=A0A9J7MYR4_BRAFL|nr:coiled-coil domain-containing protein 174-like isoform X2 [Branchiostoma floridae]
MDAKGKAIRVNAASIVDLKAELIRKQGEFKKEKLQPSTTAKPKVSSKKGGIFNKSNAGVAERSQRDVEQQAEDRKNHDKSRAALEEKAKLYDQMMKGNTIPDEDGSGVFLVDFQKKVLDSVKAQAREDAGKGQSAEGERLAAEEDAGNDDIPEPSDPEEQWVDYVDSLGRSRRCMKKDLAALQDMDRKLGPEHSQGSKDLMSADMIREEQRQKWEQEEQEALSRPVGPVHYQQVRHNEVRDMGVGYYAFSKEETERQKQMETLSMLREETQDQRVKREKLKEKRRAALQARLAKVKQRKAKRLKGEGGEMEDEGQDGSPDLGAETEDQEVQKEPEPEPLQRDETWRQSAPLREWDKGKEKHFPWIKTKEELEDERPSEFAPPKEYYKSSPSKQQTLPQKRKVSWKKKPATSSVQADVKTDRTSSSSSSSSQETMTTQPTQPLQPTQPPPQPTMQYPPFPPPPPTMQGVFPPPFMQGWPPYPPPPMHFDPSTLPGNPNPSPYAVASSFATNTTTMAETTPRTSTNSASQHDTLDSALSYFRKNAN